MAMIGLGTIETVTKDGITTVTNTETGVVTTTKSTEAPPQKVSAVDALPRFGAYVLRVLGGGGAFSLGTSGPGDYGKILNAVVSSSCPADVVEGRVGLCSEDAIKTAGWFGVAGLGLAAYLLFKGKG